jgi:hypothetical protein
VVGAPGLLPPEAHDRLAKVEAMFDVGPQARPEEVTHV